MSIRKNPAILLFPEYSELSLKDINNPVVEEKHEIVESEELKQLKSVVYSVDPVTGHPQSDIATMMSKDTNPEVARYIRDNLLQSRQSTGTLDADEALATVKTKNMSTEEYQNQILRYIDKKQKSD